VFWELSSAEYMTYGLLITHSMPVISIKHINKRTHTRSSSRSCFNYYLNNLIPQTLYARALKPQLARWLVRRRRRRIIPLDKIGESLRRS
jgi:hypothetical protein